MLRSSLRKNIDGEINTVHLGIIVFLVLLVDGFTLSFEDGVLVFQFSLLFGKSSLDDFGSGEESVFQVLESFVFDMDGGFFVELTFIFETELLEDWQEVILLGFFLRIIFLLDLLVLHLVSGFFIDTLLKNLRENFLWNWLNSLKLNNLLFLSSLNSLVTSILLIVFDLLEA
jgi:hypothetical protein